METDAQRDLRIHNEQNDLAYFRQVAFGGGALSLGIVLVVAQLAGPGGNALPPALEWAFCLSAVALPMWISCALIYDLWHTRKQSVAQLNAVTWQSAVLAFGGFIVPFFLNAAAVFLVLVQYSRMGAGMFAVTCVFGLVLHTKFLRRSNIILRG